MGHENGPAEGTDEHGHVSPSPMLSMTPLRFSVQKGVCDCCQEEQIAVALQIMTPTGGSAGAMFTLDERDAERFYLMFGEALERGADFHLQDGLGEFEPQWVDVAERE